MATYDDVLSTPMNQVKDPVPLPEGSYLATITGTPKIDKFGKNQTDGAEFSFRLNAPMEDVNPEDLQLAGGVPERPFTYTFWLTPDARSILKGFFVEVVGLDDTLTLGEGLTQVAGAQVVATVKHQISKKNGRPFPQISGFAKAA